jgi:hypothetical protein
MQNQFSQVNQQLDAHFATMDLANPDDQETMLRLMKQMQVACFSNEILLKMKGDMIQAIVRDTR